MKKMLLRISIIKYKRWLHCNFWNDRLKVLTVWVLHMHRYLSIKDKYYFKLIPRHHFSYWQAQDSLCSVCCPKGDSVDENTLSGLYLVSTEINVMIFFHLKINPTLSMFFFFFNNVIIYDYYFPNLNIYNLSKSLWRQKRPLTLLKVKVTFQL